jgi:DNA gyrase subunit A
LWNEVTALAARIADLLDILRSRARVVAIIESDLTTIRDSFGVPRRSIFIDADLDLEDEDLIEREDMVVTVSHSGYIKRTPLNAYRTQNRGGRGKSGMSTKDEDFVVRLFAASTHTPILFFSSEGQVYREKVWRLPAGDPRTKGRAIANIIEGISAGERITTVMPLPEDEDTWDNLELMFATQKGNVRRNSLADFKRIQRGGKIAMKFDEDDHIVDVAICSKDDDVMLTTLRGQAVRFPVDEVRVFKGRDSTGVRGVTLAEGDHVIAMSILRHVDASPEERAAYARRRRAVDGAVDSAGDGLVEGESVEIEADEVSADGEAPFELSMERYVELSAREQYVLAVTTDGYGKRASAYEYRVTKRGGKGITAHNLARSGSALAASFPVEDSDELMIVTDGGQLIRTRVDQIRIAGRATQGVTLIRVADGEQVVSVERLADLGGGDDEVESGGPVEEA